jgi:hypothetical protein
VDEHILAAVIANDEAEAFLRVEEFDDTLAFANDLRRHSATAAAAETAATAAAAEATASTAAVATAAAAITEAAAAEAAAVAIATAPAAEAAALLVSQVSEILFAETIALIPTASTAVTLAPSVKTHE